MQVIWCLKFCNMTKSGGDNPPAPNSGGTCDHFPPPVIYAHDWTQTTTQVTVVMWILRIKFKLSSALRSRGTSLNRRLCAMRPVYCEWADSVIDAAKTAVSLVAEADQHWRVFLLNGRKRNNLISVLPTLHM